MEGVLQPVIDRIRELREQGLSFSQIARMLGSDYTKDRVQKLYQKHFPREVKRQRVVTLGDVHALPDYRLIDMVIDRAPDLIVIGGDLLDEAAVSHFRNLQQQQRLALRSEIEQCRALLRRLLDNTEARVDIIRGNHEDRLPRIVAELLPEEVLEFFSDPLYSVVAGFERVNVARTTLYHHMPDGTSRLLAESAYLYVCGDALISHMNFYGKQPGQAARKLYDWVREWRRPLGLGEIALYVQFHGHKVSIAEVEGGFATLVEPGSAGEPSIDQYKVGYQASWGPSVAGALFFEQEWLDETWRTDLSSVELIRPYRSST